MTFLIPDKNIPDKKLSNNKANPVSAKFLVL